MDSSVVVSGRRTSTPESGVARGDFRSPEARASTATPGAVSPIPSASGMSLVELAASPRCGGEVRRVRAHDTVLDPSHDAKLLTFVRSGALRVYASLGAGGRERLSEVIGPGQWAGVEALAGLSASRTRAVAAEDSVVVVVEAGKLLSAAVSDANVGRELIRQLARQTASRTHELSEATLLACDCRLVHALLRFGRTGAAQRNGTQVTLKLTQQDLADTLGVARETVNGMLQRLAQLQLIAKRRGRIIFDVVQLEQWARHIDAPGKKR